MLPLDDAKLRQPGPMIYETATATPLPCNVCSRPSSDWTRHNGKVIHYCPQHVPANVLSWRNLAMGALMRGTAKRKWRLAQEAKKKVA